MNQYNITGQVTLDLDFFITAETEEEAIKEAEEHLEDYYHLDVVNASHTSKDIRISARQLSHRA